MSQVFPPAAHASLALIWVLAAWTGVVIGNENVIV
jgi:hypothetical protein